MFEHEPKNVSPQGKQNVYFTCYPDDFDKYFKKTFEDIRTFSNCIVWYNTEEDYRNEDITILEKMNLFVVPITTKLLTKPCRTMDVDVPYAVENKIPILPLMQENGLDELFNKKFGDRHYLNQNANDENRISYKEKFEKFVKSVLVSDELAAKVRAAFDAYIFLSYRKKDVEYANKLRHLIHKNDFCRDIAIWYDDYLTPGEDFNQAIMDAIRKCDLFTLVVTPNLINEDNYVREKEYPAAMDSKPNKPVIPVELVKTDHDELSRQYHNIPESIDAKDEEALSKVLESTLSSIARKENDKDPQHNFFIGLAYLNGIDVDINYELALSLITSAAESKENPIPEAIEKLISMYTEGHGVLRDYKVALEWQWKLVEFWETEYRKSNSGKNYQNVFFSLLELGNKYYVLRNIDAAEISYKLMLALCEQFSEDNRNLESSRHMILSYSSLGDICIERGDFIRGLNFYVKNTSLCKELLKKTGEPSEWLNLSCCYERIGYILEKQCEWNGAKEYYHKCLEIYDFMLKESESSEIKRDLSVCYLRLGDVCIAQSKFNEAKKFYIKSLIISKQLLIEKKMSVLIKDDMAACYARIGDLYMKSVYKDLEKSELFYQKNLVLTKQQLDETETVKARRDLSVSYINLGTVYIERGDTEKAIFLLNHSLFLRKRLSEETNTLESQRDLSEIYERIGYFYMKQSNINKASGYFQQCLAIRQQVAKHSEMPDLFDDLACSYYNVAICHTPYDRNLLENALDIYIKLSELYPNVIRYFENRNLVENALEQLNEIKK